MAKLPWVDEEAIVRSHQRIYHYTEKKTLAPILKSGGLLATHFENTNDSQEFTALRAPVVELFTQSALPIFKERIEKGEIKFNQPVSDLQELVRGDAERLFDILVQRAPTPSHICCFSTHDQPYQVENGLLTMWRLYGGTEGIALGFDTAKFVTVSEQIIDQFSIATMFLIQVLYGRDHPEVMEKLEESQTLRFLMSTILIDQIDGVETNPETLAEDLLRCFVLFASTKHQDFEDEREIRLVTCVSINSEEQGRLPPENKNGRLLVRCLDALDEVLVGPSDRQEEMLEGVRRELDFAGLERVDVRMSGTPFRRI